MEKYQLKISPDELSIKPYFGYMTKIKWFALLAFFIFVTIPFIKDKVSYDIWTIGYVISGVFVFYILYDFLFHVNVKFVFDKQSRFVYKINPPFFKKKLMSFDEMTIINLSEYGTMEYAIGWKKKEFLKNYSISDTFANSKKSRQQEQEYVTQILNPILEFVANKTTE